MDLPMKKYFIPLTSFALLFLTGAALHAGSADRLATLDGARVHYQSYGSGDNALVFIHGWTCDLTFWRLQAPVYQSHRSILIDLPGHGTSDKPETEYTMDYFARAVDAVLSGEHIKKATLVGHSMGTNVIIQYLRLYPEKVAALVIVDGFAPEPPENEEALAKQTASVAKMISIFQSPNVTAIVPAMISSMFTPRTPAELRNEIRSKMQATPVYVLSSAMKGMLTMQPVDERWPNVPVFAVFVKRGSTPHHQAFLSEHFDLKDVTEYAGAGHFLMMEEPDRFNMDLLNFVDGRSTASN